ncbi:unnamed protein product [Rotaria sordida]|uniref:tRNA synthetases class I catalytic domain-containing protein n=1 Tax=Rotaria sordida TaxID=392033 RepID=A0A814SL02_9BILA|nr:unnamed protein product [Rotaria sordida]
MHSQFTEETSSVLSKSSGTTSQVRLKLYNNFTKTKVDFIPLDGNVIRWFSRGPSVSDTFSTSYIRYFMSIDVIHRILSDYFNYDVIFGMNLTDINDKIIREVRERSTNRIETLATYQTATSSPFDKGDRLPTVSKTTKYDTKNQLHHTRQFIERLLVAMERFNILQPSIDKMLDRFCTSILPQKHHCIKKLILETTSMERILLAGDYPNLTSLELFGFEEEIVFRYFTGNISNRFPNMIFDTVTHLYAYDTIPMEHEFFMQISRNFPKLKCFSMKNDNSQTRNCDQWNSYPIIEYSHLISLDIMNVNTDYVEQFLLQTKTHLPCLTELKVNYNQLATVTMNFTRDETRHNCSKVKRLILKESKVFSKDYYRYFPSL